MFGQIAAFELRYQLRQPVFWVVGMVFFLLTFGSMVIDQIQIGSGGNVLRNSPAAITQIMVIWTLFYMLITTAFVANVIVRDIDTGFGPIIRATRLRKFDYLYGRFTGAFIAVALSFLFIPLAIFLGSIMPWVDPETLGPNRFEFYAFPYLVMALPGLLLTSAIFFALATVTRSMMMTYVGVVALFIIYLVATASLARPEFEDLLAYLEPFGVAAYGLETRYWTAAESNTRLPELAGPFLHNRLIWIGASFGFLALAYGLFRFETRGAKLSKAEKLKAAADASVAVRPAGSLPRPTYGWASGSAQLTARTRFEMGQVFKSPAFFVLLVLGLANSIAGLWFSSELYGTQILPVTRSAIETLRGAFSLIPIIIAIYYAGELVWRERERRTHEIIDSTPVPDWAFVVPKSLAIALVLLATLVVSAAAGVLVQALKGYFNFELGKYLLWYVLPSAVDWTLIAILAVFLQALVPHKFLGWGLMVLYLIATITLGQLGFEHNLYLYGSSPGEPLSDMNGQGDYWKAAAWFRAYWTAIALILLVLAYGLWRRGTETRLLPRLRRLPRRLAGPAGVIAGLAALVAIGTGSFIFLNTNIWNEYESSIDAERQLAEYERTLLAYEAVPQPSVVSVALNVDLDPHAPRATTYGAYVVENRHDEPLEAIHIRWDPSLDLRWLRIDGTELEREYEDFNYRIYRFARPLQPGERRTVVFETRLEQRGFRNSGNTTRIVDNGTFLNNFEIAPLIGMDRSGLLQDRADRRRYGLPAELRRRDLDDPQGLEQNYINADWVRADITVTTVADQTPVAPGYRVSDDLVGERRTARFVTEAPILHFFSIQSARYDVRRETYRDVELAVYYDPQHPYNVDRMIRAMREGLDYFETNFGEYQFRQARILEFPDYAQFAQAFANTMPYSEGIGFIADIDDESADIDYVTYVTAHELAHQWWAHQVVSADVQGAETLTETLAQYSALMVMEQIYGPDQIRRFLKYELDRYLRARGSEVLEELPLYRVENQGYIHYQKGALVMYLLRDQMGEEAVNRALRRIIADHAFRGAPYPTSRDLIAALRAEAGPEHQQLITDLFERITLYDVKVDGVEVERLREGRWQVTLTVSSRKLYADGQGVETETPMDEVFDVGLFTAEPGDDAFDREDVILFERRRLTGGEQTFTFITDREPTHVGVDPYNKRIDRNSNDNVLAVD